ncbi:enoyl-CoA hydratase/isomerase family protein [Noviherbaspirillum sedimenti]|uniref:Enoyl-CoA hydratase/isomerase family protein n=1 Tax=Noviherbaspirillum sedimenti TaxID=2320865 RepID=A0A3A3G405_9BURK|nr:enoyl-CoA hydratase/isomerase family protein [Noviherbaspirillum sedimenti]RJG02661.1 enoyl-CoA hydratase/isomerase family protein [Noviherbaspirillum sedimenti]
MIDAIHDNDAPEILIERRDGVAILLFNRPRAANAQGFTFGGALLSALDEIERDDSVSAIVISGVGKVFCAGGKIGEIMKVDGVDMEEQLRAIRQTFRAVQRIREHDLPVICALNGAAIGGGAALALACDLVVAAEEGSYSFPFGRLGAAAADMGCAYLLPRIVGTARAKQILLTGATINAHEGRADGLFVDVVPRAEVLDTAVALARSIIAAGPRRAVAATKQILLRGESADYATCTSYELYLQCYMLSTDGHKERLKGFLDSRKA